MSGADRGAPAAGSGLQERLAFVLELDRLKTIERRTTLIDGSRYENTAEHSWHLAMLALSLAEHADEPVDVGHVLRLLVCHDIVEIDADDTFVYDLAGNESKAAREQAAADRIFGLLPGAEGERLRGYWREYEERSSPEGRFAYALDRLQPMLLNHGSGGGSWQEHGIRADQVLAINRPIAAGSIALWEHAQDVVTDGLEQGWLQPPAGEARDDAPGPPAYLHTDRLTLRWPRLGDADAIFEGWAADADVTQFLTWAPHDSVTTVESDYLRTAIHELGTGEEFTWLLDHPEHGVIGSIAARPDPDHGVELGYAIAKAHWGQGYATEVVRAVTESLLGRDGVVRVWAYTDVANAASGAVLRKSGFDHEGTLKRFGRCGGGAPVDCHVYSRTV